MKYFKKLVGDRIYLSPTGTADEEIELDGNIGRVKIIYCKKCDTYCCNLYFRGKFYKSIDL